MEPVNLSTQILCPAKIIKYSGKIKNVQALLSFDANNTIVEGSDQNTFLVIDFGKEVVGMVEIAVEDGADSKLRVKYGESLSEATSEAPWIVDEVTLPPGRFNWRSGPRRAFRYLNLSFIKIKKPVIIKTVFAYFSSYPVEYKGEFFCSDELLNKIWDIGRYTVQCCMQDIYLDGPKRDAMVWVEDARIEGLINYYCFGDKKLMVRSMEMLAEKPRADGSIVSGIGAELFVPEYCANWINLLWEYYLYSGDREIVESFYPTVIKQINFFRKISNKDNLLSVDFHVPDFALFIYMANASHLPSEGEEVVKGYLFSGLQMVYYSGIIDALKLADLMGDKANRIKWKKLALKVKISINEKFWSEKFGCYIDYYKDGLPGERISQLANSLAIIFGIAEKSKYARIYNNVFKNSNIEELWKAHVNFYIILSLLQLQKEKEALERIRKIWGEMINRGATTFWENFDLEWWKTTPGPNAASLCHGWSGGPTYILPALVCGIQPLSGGFSKVSIKPRLGDLKWARARVPTPYGDIYTRWEQGKGKLQGILEIPRACNVVLGCNKDFYRGNIYFNGVNIIKQGKVMANEFRIEELSQDDNYAYILIPEGGKCEVIFER